MVSADLSADGKVIVSAGKDRALKVWDAAAGTELHTFALTPPVAPDAAPVLAPMPILAAFAGTEILVVAADGSLIALAGSDGTIRRDQPRSLAVDAAAFSPDRKLLAIAAAGSLHVFTTGDGDEVCSAAGIGVVDELDFDRQGKKLAAATRDGTLSLWDPRACTPGWHVQAHAVEATSAAFSPDGTHLVTASRDYTFKMWDLVARREVTVAHGQTRAVTGVAFADDHIVSTSLDGSVRAWDPLHGNSMLLAQENVPVWAVAGAPGADLAVTAADDGQLTFFSLRKSASVAVESAHAGGAFALAMSADGTRLVSGGRDGQVKVWDVAHHKRAGGTKGHSSQIDALALEPDGKRGVSGDDDGRVRLLDAAHAREDERLATHDGPVLAAAIAPGLTPGSALVVTGGEDGAIQIDDRSPKHRAKPTVIAAHTLAVTALSAFPVLATAPHARFAISGSLDGTLAIWDITTGDLVDRIDLSASGDVPLTLAVAADGRSFLVGTRRGVILQFAFDAPRVSAATSPAK